jgi:hypothetical protein
MRMNKSLQKARDEFIESDEFANGAADRIHDRVPHRPRGCCSALEDDQHNGYDVTALAATRP